MLFVWQGGICDEEAFEYSFTGQTRSWHTQRKVNHFKILFHCLLYSLWRPLLKYLTYPQWSHLDFYLNSKRDPTCLSSLMSWCLWHVCRKKFHVKGVGFAPFGAFFDRWYYFLKTSIVANVTLSTKSNVWVFFFLFCSFPADLDAHRFIKWLSKRSKPQRNQKENVLKCSWEGREIWSFDYF